MLYQTLHRTNRWIFNYKIQVFNWPIYHGICLQFKFIFFKINTL